VHLKFKVQFALIFCSRIFAIEVSVFEKMKSKKKSHFRTYVCNPQFDLGIGEEWLPKYPVIVP